MKVSPTGRQQARDAEEKATAAETLISEKEYGRAVAMIAPLIHRVGEGERHCLSLVLPLPLLPKADAFARGAAGVGCARLEILHLKALVGDEKYVRGAEMSMGLLKRVGQTPVRPPHNMDYPPRRWP